MEYKLSEGPAEALAKEGNISFMYYVYILQSLKDKSLYKGFTEDLKERLKIHNGSGDDYSARKRPWKLIWYCALDNKKKALNFEKYLKSGSGRAFINKHLI